MDNSIVPRLVIGGVSISRLSRAETADLMIEVATTRPRTSCPPLFTSANGEVLSQCARSKEIARLFRDAAVVSADGQPMVIASRLIAPASLPERVATTDLFHDVAVRAAKRKMSFAVLGATEEENRRAVRCMRRMYPGIVVVNHSHGYLSETAESQFVKEVSRTRADILWVCLGSPREQAFYDRWKAQLSGVGVVKTGGGLLNFLSGSRARAPSGMQSVGFEWLYRVMLEPRRLFWRYLRTNPHAFLLLLTRTKNTELH